MCVTTSTIAVGRNATTSSTPFHGPPFTRRKSPSPISCAIPIASTATSTATGGAASHASRSEEHTSELQSRLHLVCRLLLEKKKKEYRTRRPTATTDPS